MSRAVLYCALALSVSAWSALASGEMYADKDTVPVVASKIGPYFNPSETYPYYTLPFCAPEKLEHQGHNLGEILSGDRKVVTKFELLFKVPYQFRRLCKKTLTVDELKQFHTAIDEDWYYEMVIDGLPVWGYVGGIQTPSPESFSFKTIDEVDLRAKKFIYTHQVFTVAYNGNHIIAVNITNSFEHRIDVSALREIEVDFTYQVNWVESDIPFEQRAEHLQKAEFLPATFEIHWLSIINTFVLVVLLTVFLAVILIRVLKNDFTRYMQTDEEEEFLEEESGWKLIHGDVFRFPVNKTLLCAILGAGVHLLCTVLLVLVLALFSVFSPTKKGAMSTVVLVLYALTSGTSGFVSSSMYKQMGGENWVWTTVLTAILLPGPLLAIFSVLNSIAISYGSSAALPFGTIMAVFCVYLLVTFPLTVIGAVIGKRRAKPFKAPCRTSKAPRQIPEVPWYRRPLLQFLIAGFMPFSSIYIELHFVFASIWGHKVYTLFGILLMALTLLLVVTSFTSVALTYYQLAVEDHHWWWRSLAYGGASSVFVYAYSFYYYYERSAMSGLLQTSFYFGYMAYVSYCFFLILGTVGFFSSFTFVKAIYSALKLD
mmetsp:Transcript_14470/g.25928  ORF Transcript_14470/g.25928 Transcript_14470/m.25928 type:complete len:598 (+) Transcript_14470:86-1879(+)